MVCFYLRLLQLEEENNLGENQDILNWFQKYGLSESQKTSLQDLSEALQPDGEGDLSILNDAFHKVLKQLFCWTETKRLLDEMLGLGFKRLYSFPTISSIKYRSPKRLAPPEGKNSLSMVSPVHSRVPHWVILTDRGR